MEGEGVNECMRECMREWVTYVSPILYPIIPHNIPHTSSHRLQSGGSMKLSWIGRGHRLLLHLLQAHYPARLRTRT